MKKTLFIGLGGCGLETVAQLSKKLAAQENEDTKYMYLYIDTDEETRSDINKDGQVRAEQIPTKCTTRQPKAQLQKVTTPNTVECWNGLPLKNSAISLSPTVPLPTVPWHSAWWAEWALSKMLNPLRKP